VRPNYCADFWRSSRYTPRSSSTKKTSCWLFPPLSDASGHPKHNNACKSIDDQDDNILPAAAA